MQEQQKGTVTVALASLDSSVAFSSIAAYTAEPSGMVLAGGTALIASLLFDRSLTCGLTFGALA